MWNIGHTWAVVGRAAISEANKSFSVSASQCPPNSFEAFLLNADFKMTFCHLNWLLSKDSNEVMAGDDAQPQVLSFQASSCHLLVSSVTAAFAVGSCRGKMLWERGELYLGHFWLSKMNANIRFYELSNYLWAEKVCVLVGCGKAGASSLGGVAGPASERC